MSREPKRLDEMPDRDRVTIGHPSQAAAVRREAAANLTDYFLSPLVPVGSVYVMNMDQAMAPPVWDFPVWNSPP